MVKYVFETWRPLTAEHRPDDLGLDVGVLAHPAVLEGIPESRVERMTYFSVAVRNSEVFGARIALGNKWDSCNRHVVESVRRIYSSICSRDLDIHLSHVAHHRGSSWQ